MFALHEIIQRYTNTKLFQLLFLNRGDLIWIFIASSIANLLMLTPMLYMLQIFDRIFISKSVLTLLTISFVIVFFYMISALSSYIRSQITISIGLKLEKQVNKKLFQVGFEERLRKEIANPTSYLDDLTMIRQWFTGAAIFSVFDLPWVPLYVLVMFIMHPFLGYISLVLILILIIFGMYFSRVLGDQDELLRKEEYETNDFLYGKLRHSEVLSVYALATNFKESWKKNKHKFYLGLNRNQKKTDTVQNITKQYRFLSNSIALTAGAFLVINGELTLGSMIAASLLMARTTQPVDGAVTTLSRISIVKEAFWRIEKMLNIAPIREKSLSGDDKSPVSDKTRKIIKNVSLKGVDVSYKKDLLIFRNLQLSMKSGEVISVVGKSGVGKSTLIKLLSGLVNYHGTIKFDSLELRDLTDSNSENLIGYLPQDVAMVPGTVAENIAGLRVPDSKRTVEVAKLAGIHDFILRFPEGYDSKLFGGYQNLSGGERQRVGLARAIYNDPACLFLDEPNAALDHFGELALKNVVNHCKNKGKLILIVTHRRSVLSYSDKVLDLSDNTPELIERDKYISRFDSEEKFNRRFTF